MFKTTGLEPEHWAQLVIEAGGSLVTSCILVHDVLVIEWAATSQTQQRKVLKALNVVAVIIEAKQRVKATAKSDAADAKRAAAVRKVRKGSRLVA
jgi:hypothetical protein